MEGLMKGDVVVLPFPFSDLSGSKNRPAVVAANLAGDDIILCQITASHWDSYSVRIAIGDFQEGRLNLNSNIRPNRIFTAEKSIILYKVGGLKSSKIKKIEDSIVQIFRN